MADISLIIDTNADEAARDVDRLKNSTNNLGNSMQGAVKDTKILSTAQQASGNIARTAGRKMNGTGMAIQQVGYQTGDFLVQIQSGTNAMVAFGQQATQLVGVLPMVAGNLGLSMGAAIGLSAGLGILIPLVTAVGAYFMRSGKASKSFEDNLSDLETQVKDYAEATERSRDAMRGAREEFGFTSGVLQTIVGDLQIISRIGAFDKLGDTVAKLRVEHIQGFESDLENIKDLLGVGGWFSAIGDEVIAFNSALLTMESNAYSLENRLDSALDLRQMLLDNSGGIDDMTDAQYDFFVALTQTIQEMEIMLGVGDNIKNNQDVLVEGAEGFLAIWEAIRDVVKEASDNMGSGQTLSDSQYQQMLYYQQYAETLGAAPDTPVKHPDKPSSSSVSKGADTISDAEKLQAYLDGKQEEFEIEEALLGLFGAERTIKSELLGIQNDYAGVITTAQSAELEATLQQIEAVKELQALEEKRMDLAADIAQSFADGINSIVDGTKKAKDAFRDMAIAILKDLWDVYVMQQIVGMVTKFVGGALGGSNFSKAGSSGNISGGMKALGDAFNGGNVVPFANGGVVGSPTLFGMAGGRTGLMGEAGPEAIMPLKRGADGKLGVESSGGSQSVVVNQSFNFSANGDESVKKIIAQAAPQIAQMTQKSMMDQRRRGGALKSTFG